MNTENVLWIRMRGLPFSSAEEDVINFFKPIKIKTIHFPSASNKRGECYCCFGCVDDYEQAKTYDRNMIANRYIELIDPSSKEIEMLALDKFRCSYNESHSSSNELYYVKMRGLPFTATEQDIRLFFYGLEIVEIVLATNCGKQNGEGIVIFRNKDDLTAALKKDRQNLGNRYVELFRSDSQEYESMKVDDNNVEKGMMKRRHRDADPYYPNKKTQRDSNVQDYANMAPTYQENGYFFNSDAVNYRKHINLPTNNYGSFYNTSSFKSNEYSAKMPQYSSSSIAFGGQELHETKPHHAFNKGIDMNAGSEDSYYSKQEEQALSLNQIQMRGIPFKITFPDIEQFFSPLSLSNVKLGYLEGSTRLSGDAIVSFHTVNDAIKALDKDKQTISSRYIELFNSKNAKLGKRTIYKYIHGQDSSESTANLPDIDDNHRQQNASTHPVPSRFGDNEGNAKPMRDNEPYLPQSVSYGNSYHQHGDHDSRTRSSGFFTNTTYKQMHIKQEGPSEYFRSQSKFF